MKKIISFIMVAVLLLSISVTAFAVTPTFSESFESYDDMCAFVEMYSADYPDVEYADGVGLSVPVKGYELKDKPLVLISVDNPEYNMTMLTCGESSYNFGIDYTQCRFVKSDETTFNVMAYYHHNADQVLSYVEYFAGMEAFSHEFCCPDGKIYTGEIDGYYYEAFYYTFHNKTSYRIAVDDVVVYIDSNGAYDEEFVNSLVLQKSEVVLKVQEISPYAPILVTDEVLNAVRIEYDNEEITKEEITVTDYLEIGDGKKLARVIVAGYAYTCDEVEQKIGVYTLIVPQRPLPQILINGVFYDISDAYETSLIDNADLKTISNYNSESFTFKTKVFIKGDVDDDKHLSVIDATFIQMYLCQIPINKEFAAKYADFDDDGEITILDATAIQLELAGLNG